MWNSIPAFTDSSIPAGFGKIMCSFLDNFSKDANQLHTVCRVSWFLTDVSGLSFSESFVVGVSVSVGNVNLDRVLLALPLSQDLLVFTDCLFLWDCLFFAFSSIRSGSNCRHSESAVSLIPTTSLSLISSSFISPYLQLSASAYCVYTGRAARHSMAEHVLI